MRKGTFTFQQFELTIGEPIEHVDKRFGEVYKSIDSHKVPHLLQLMQIKVADENLNKYYSREKDVQVC